MQVTFLAGGYQPERCGVADYLTQLRAALTRRSIVSQVITTHASAQLANQPDVLGVVKDWSLPHLLPLVHRLRAHPTNLLHIQHAAGSYRFQRAIFLLPLLLRLAGYRPPIITTAHEYGGWEWQPAWLPAAGLEGVKTWGQRRGWWDREDGWLLTGSQAIITSNDRIESLMRDRLLHLGDRLHSIPLAPNISVAPIDRAIAQRRVRDTSGWPAAAEVIVFFGFLHPVKGIETLLAAMVQVIRQRPTARLLLLGGVETLALRGEAAQRYWQTIQNQRDSLGLQDVVHCTGYVRAETASHYLSGADIGVLPFHGGVTLKSGSLLALLAHGLPTVITASDATNPVLHQADWLKRVPPRSVSALATTLTDLLSDRSHHPWQSEAGLRFVASRNWEAIATHHQAIYQQLLE